jgi:hypothetical protein
VTSVENISAGDKIRLDINSLGHGIETVSVTRVGTEANRTSLAANASSGATNIKVRSTKNFAIGNVITIGTPPNRQTATIVNVGTSGPNGNGIEFTPALSRDHSDAEEVVEPGTGLDLASPLKFSHAANLPFSDRGTGISFRPATAFAHRSNEPLQPLGTGITLDRALTHDHAIDAVVRDAAVTNAGYQGSPSPNQWFGGPELSTNAPLFERRVILRQGSMVLRDASGLVVDSLNYGGLVDPWAAVGNQAASGFGESGCYVTAPGLTAGFGPLPSEAASSTSAGRFPDGYDHDSNCTDFRTTPATTMAANADPGATDIKVAGVEGFQTGQTIRIDAGGNLETAVIAHVGTPGAATLRSATPQGATVIPVSSARSFSPGETISIGTGAEFETAVVAASGGFRSANITAAAPLTFAHQAGAQVSGTGITLTAPLSRQHASGAQIAGSLPTPGAPNHYDTTPH